MQSSNDDTSEERIDLYDWQVEEIKKAVYEADHGGKFYSSEEVSAWLKQRRQ